MADAEFKSKEKVPKIRSTFKKKWTTEDELRVLHYLLNSIHNNQEIEKPSARIYYNKLIEETPAFKDLNFEHFRNKVKNFKRAYISAIHWRNINVNETDISDENIIKEYITKWCPHYELLNEIFSGKYGTITPKTEHSMYTPSITMNMDVESTSSESFEKFPEIENNITNDNVPYNNFTEFQPFTREEWLKKRLELDSIRLENQNNWELKKIKLEEKKMGMDIMIKEKQIESHERIEMAKLEKEERVAKFELQLRYRIKMNSPPS